MRSRARRGARARARQRSRARGPSRADRAHRCRLASSRSMRPWNRASCPAPRRPTSASPCRTRPRRASCARRRPLSGVLRCPRPHPRRRARLQGDRLPRPSVRMPLCAISCPRYYNSWHQCAHDFSDDEPQCTRLKQWAYSMCPLEWVRRAHPNPGRPPASPRLHPARRQPRWRTGRSSARRETTRARCPARPRRSTRPRRSPGDAAHGLPTERPVCWAARSCVPSATACRLQRADRIDYHVPRRVSRVTVQQTRI